MQRPPSAAISHPDDGGLGNGPKVAQVIAQVTGSSKVWLSEAGIISSAWSSPGKCLVPGTARGTRRRKWYLKKLPERKAELEQRYPGADIEVHC